MKSARQAIGWFALTLGLLALSFAVFNWGLQYKMSLYQSTSGVTQAPAKLWTGKVTTSAAAVATPTQEAPRLLATAQPAILRSVVCRRPLGWVNSRFAIPWKRQVRHALRAFSFRPPPALA